MLQYIRTPNTATNQVLGHIFAAGGKRLRPALFLLVCNLIGYEGDHLFPIASVCEYIHTASLLHDDVIDNSTLRRNKPTANSIWGNETSVLAGDLIYSTACRLMVTTRSLDLIDTFAECIRKMSESELFQLELLWNASTSQSDYNSVVHGKTAILFEACTATPVYLNGIDIKHIQFLKDFGRNLGFAFQIADDCLDYDGTEAEVGKKLCADLREGKVTLPLILGMQQDSELSTFVTKYCSSANRADEKNLVQLVLNSGGIALARSLASKYAASAILALDSFVVQTNVKSDSAALLSLRNIPKFIMERNL